MPFDSSATLKSTGPAATLAAAYLVGVESSPGKVRELVSGAEQAITLTGASRGSDADGAYIETSADAHKAEIAATVDPDGTFSVVYVWKSAEGEPTADWAGLSLLKNGSGALVNMQRFGTDNDIYSLNIGAGDRLIAAPFPEEETLHCIVLHYDGSTYRLYSKGAENPATVNFVDTQTSGAATVLVIGHNDYKSWRGRHYLWALSNEVWDGTTAQAVANDPLGVLFDSEGEPEPEPGARDFRIPRGIARGIGRGVSMRTFVDFGRLLVPKRPRLILPRRFAPAT